MWSPKVSSIRTGRGKVALEALETCAALEPKRRDPGPVCLLDMEWADNIWHWLLECVPRVVALEDSGFDGRYLIADQGLHRDVLRLLGLGPDRIAVRPSDPVLYRRLLVTDQITGCNIHEKPWLLRRMRERFAERVAISQKRTRIYIARRGDVRSVANEDEVLDVLRAYDVRLVYAASRARRSAGAG